MDSASTKTTSDDERTFIIVSNRGPVGFYEEEGRLRAKRGGGGLVTALSSLRAELKSVWISSAMTPADRKVAGRTDLSALSDEEMDGEIRLVDIPENAYDAFYNRISNPLLWFIFHHLWSESDLPSKESMIRDWREGYLAVNRLMAEAAIREAEESPMPVIMLHDYHLLAAARYVKEIAPDIPVIHFNHIPWPEPEVFTLLPAELRRDMLTSLLSADILGFQAERYAHSFIECCAELKDISFDAALGALHSGDRSTLVRAYPISINTSHLRATAARKEVIDHARRIERENDGYALLVRSDRADPSKNIVRGFEAYDRLLLDHPELKGIVRFLAFLYPTRENIGDYSDYRRLIEQTVREINERHATESWEPIGLRIEDDYLESVAALTLYDILLVNPVMDGMNLVAKEGPIINGRNGLLVLSENAGAHAELGWASLSIDPLDIGGTADALYTALTMPAGERIDRSAWLREIVERNDSGKWLRRQLADLDMLGRDSNELSPTRRAK